MPKISEFYGIVSFEDNVLRGQLPTRVVRMVREWAGARRTELLANWSRARKGREPVQVAPLRSQKGFAKLGVDPECGTIVWSDQADISPETLYLLPDERENARPAKTRSGQKKPGKGSSSAA